MNRNYIDTSLVYVILKRLGVSEVVLTNMANEVPASFYEDTYWFDFRDLMAWSEESHYRNKVSFGDIIGEAVTSGYCDVYAGGSNACYYKLDDELYRAYINMVEAKTSAWDYYYGDKK